MSYPFPVMNPWLENPLVREALIGSDVHFVEIELLRAYPPMPFTEHLTADYRIVDLGTLLHEVYDRARYRLVIDYNKPPTPQLDTADADWVADCFTAAQRQKD